MLGETLAALMLGLIVLWLLFEPMLFPARMAPEFLEPEDPDETPRGQALLALREIDFDRATGKLSDEDYETLKARYMARAVALLKAESEPGAAVPAPDPIEALIADRVQTLGAGDGMQCPTCGPRPESDARFCSSCGTSLRIAGPACPACRAAIHPGDRFCGACGTTIAAAPSPAAASVGA